MTTLSVLGIINLIRRHKPNAGDNMIAYATAIALAESGGRLGVISPSGDYGLWQINRRFHFGDGIINASNWQDPDVQFLEMYKLSGRMFNWGAWCTAYDSGDVAQCGSLYLAYPQPGSPADDQLNVVNSILLPLRGTPPTGQAPNMIPPNEQFTPAQSADFNYIKTYLASGYSYQLLHLAGTANAIQQLFR